VYSCASEYVGLLIAARDAVWMSSLLCEVGECSGILPTLIHHDNQGSISLAEGRPRKVNHVDMKYNFTHHLIQTVQVKVTDVPSDENLADGLTKALAGRTSRGVTRRCASSDRRGVLNTA
jgi:hypothetical protein